MARPYRKRDPQGNPERLLRAVGQILRDKGHQFLYLNEIARVSEVGKKYVSKCFGSVNALIKVYILRTDFWLPRFEEVKQNPLPENSDDLLKFYIISLQDQFRFFSKSVELQKIILWQITESNALMRTISETREKEGAQLLALADAHFKDSGISLKAVVALILGGGYYIALQASTNNSPVCGIDINQERDAQIFIDTMGQILEWAWKAADDKHKELIP